MIDSGRDRFDELSRMIDEAIELSRGLHFELAVLRDRQYNPQELEALSEVWQNGNAPGC